MRPNRGRVECVAMPATDFGVLQVFEAKVTPKMHSADESQGSGATSSVASAALAARFTHANETHPQNPGLRGAARGLGSVTLHCVGAIQMLPLTLTMRVMDMDMDMDMERLWSAVDRTQQVFGHAPGIFSGQNAPYQ